MELFRLNKLFIIESLPDDEIKTGHLLYKALMSEWKNGSYSNIKRIEYIDASNTEAIYHCFDNIVLQVAEQHVLPYIHIEMHSDGTTGLILKNDEVIPWNVFFKRLQQINYAAHNYLFLTMGVCHGLNILFYMKIYDHSPFYGAVGSFFELLNTDLLYKFASFYDEVLRSADINKAMDALRKDNPHITMDSKYDLIDTVMLFRKVYMNYLVNKCSKSGILKRVYQSFPAFLRIHHIIFPNRRIRRYFKNRFVRRLHKTKDQEYRRARNKFLMYEFPEIKDRFLLPDNVYDFRHSC